MNGIVNSYGIHWSVDAVDWGGHKWRLEGEAKIKGQTHICNFREDVGIYALYEGRDLMYVGLAHGTPLGQELYNRQGSRFAGRWDAFSWFGLGNRQNDIERKNTDKKKYKTVKAPKSRILQPGALIKDLEALMIMLTNPPLNRRHESFKKAVEFEQIGQDHIQTDRQLLRKMLTRLESLEGVVKMADRR